MNLIVAILNQMLGDPLTQAWRQRLLSSMQGSGFPGGEGLGCQGGLPQVGREEKQKKERRKEKFG